MRYRLCFYKHRRHNGQNQMVNGMNQGQGLRLFKKILEFFLALKSNIVSLLYLSKTLFPKPHVEETG